MYAARVKWYVYLIPAILTTTDDSSADNRTPDIFIYFICQNYLSKTQYNRQKQKRYHIKEDIIDKEIRKRQNDRR